MEPSKQADDTPKAFARLFRYKEIAEQKRKEKEGAKNNNQEQKPGIAVSGSEHRNNRDHWWLLHVT